MGMINDIIVTTGINIVLLAVLYKLMAYGGLI